MELASTDTELDPPQQNLQQANSHFQDEDFINGLEARNSISTSVQLGKQFSKPSVLENCPSAGFVFTRPVTSNAALIRTTSLSQIKPNKSLDAIVSRMQNSVINQAGAVGKPTKENILSLSSAQEQCITHANHASAIVPDDQVVFRADSTICSDRISPVPTTEKPNKPGSREQQLQALISTIDTPILLKVLAFTYHQENKEHQRLVGTLRAEIQDLHATNSEDVQKLKQADKQKLELTQHVAILEQDIEGLKQQLQDASACTPTEQQIVNYMQTLGRKVDQLFEERRKENQAADELAKANQSIRQLADDLRQYRSQKAFHSNQSRMQQMHSAVIRAKNKDEPLECDRSKTGPSPVKNPPQRMHVRGQSVPLVEEPQELPCHEQSRPEFDDKDLEEIASIDSPSQVEDDQQQPPTPSANSSLPRIMSRTMMTPGVNKFGKRTSLESRSEGVRPAKRSSTHLSHRRVGDNELRAIGVLQDKSTNSQPRIDSSKKASRGAGGG